MSRPSADRARRARALAAAAAVLSALAASPRADACGAWGMTDVPRKLAVDWLINAGSITRPPSDARLANLYLDLDGPDGIRVVADRRVVLDIHDHRILRYGKPVGTLEADRIVIGGDTYTVQLAQRRIEHGARDSEIYVWRMEVRRGDDLILTSDDASALCGPIQHGGMTEREQQLEVERRVAFYLVWRARGL